MSWRTLDGRTKRLAVLEVVKQPEAQEFDLDREPGATLR